MHFVVPKHRIDRSKAQWSIEHNRTEDWGKRFMRSPTLDQHKVGQLLKYQLPASS